MRVFLRFLEIFIVGILLAALAVEISFGLIVFNMKGEDRQINRTEIYEFLDNASKENTDPAEVLENCNLLIYSFKDMIMIAILSLLVLIIIILIVSIVVSKEKFNVAYKPFILAGLLVIAVRVAIGKFISEIEPDAYREMGDELANGLFDPIKNNALLGLNISIAVFLVIGFGLMAIKYAIKYKDKQNEKNVYPY